MFEFIKIVALAVLAAVAYGIAHDMVTAHVCVEYFSVAHPPVIGPSPPFVYALVWGVIATWWVGLPLGVMLAFVACVGRYNKLRTVVLLKPLRWFLGVQLVLSMSAGMVGYILASQGSFTLRKTMAAKIDAARHARFAFDLFAHNAAYAIGGLGGLVLIAWVLKARLDGKWSDSRAETSTTAASPFPG